MSHVPADGIPHEGAGSIRFVFDALADGRDSLPAPRKWCHKFQLDVKNNFFALFFFQPSSGKERAVRHTIRVPGNAIASAGDPERHPQVRGNSRSRSLPLRASPEKRASRARREAAWARSSG